MLFLPKAGNFLEYSIARHNYQADLDPVVGCHQMVPLFSYFCNKLSSPKKKVHLHHLRQNERLQSGMSDNSSGFPGWVASLMSALPVPRVRVHFI